jgi:hypothetical protein
MKRLSWVFACSALLLSREVRSGEFFACGHEHEEQRVEYRFDPIDQVHAKIAFVAFPGDIPAQLGPQHQAVVDQVSTYLHAQSHGRLTFSEHTEVLLHAGENMQDLMAGTATAWMADEAPSFYHNVSSPGGDEYIGYWQALGVDDWWGNQGDASHLYAEILYRIWQEYQAIGSPFGDLPGNDTYELYFIFLSNASPFAWPADGKPAVRVHAGTVRQETGGFFDNLGDSRAPYIGGFAGVGQIHCTGWSAPQGDDPDYHPPHAEFRPHESAYSLLHEFVHTLGPGDGPPALQDTPQEKRYFYGNLNLLCQHLPQSQGVPPIGLGWLATLPWLEVVDFTGLNLKEQVVYDVYTGEAVGIPEDPKGKIYMFRRMDGGRDERFYIAYHAGVSIDAQPRYDDPATPLVPARGLEIWHCEPTGTMFDIESAFGLYRDIVFDVMPGDARDKPPEYFATTWSGGFDPEHGYDNYDLWQMVNQTGPRSKGEYRRYQGDVFDFFRKDLTGAYAAWNKLEFSYRSNPNCFWYSLDPLPPGEPNVMLRRNPQNVENSMIVRLREQHDDAIPDPYAVVDFLSAPYEDVEAPGGTANETYEGEQEITIRWGDDFADAINRVEIFYSPLGGYPHSYVPIADLALDPGQTSWGWMPQELHESSEGRINPPYSPLPPVG